MTRFRRLYAAAALALGGLGFAHAPAWSQSSCPIGAPVVVSATSYTLTNNNQCQALVFSAGTVTAITVPAADTVAPGWQAMLIATGGGITLTASGSSTINNYAAATIGQGQSAILFGDGSKFWLGVGSGFVMQPPLGSSFAGLTGSTIFPGVLFENSEIVAVPNGVLKITNPASFAPAPLNDGCRRAPMADPTVQPSWLRILDWRGKPRSLLVC